MPVSFLTAVQRESYGRFATSPSPDEIAQFFHLSDDDLGLIAKLRGQHNRLGFALQLTAVRFLGVFLENPTVVPGEVLQTLIRQLNITNADRLQEYQEARRHRKHALEIGTRYGYRDFSDPIVGFRLSRWLYVLCWTGTERPSTLFERAKTWLLTQKVILPGISVLERFVAKLRSRVEMRIWRLLGRGVNAEERKRLENLLSVPEGSRISLLDQYK